jgi:hypothetical protein
MIILIGKDNRCTCDCADKCIKGKIGSEHRCTKEEIESEGYKAMTLKEMNKELKYLKK